MLYSYMLCRLHTYLAALFVGWLVKSVGLVLYMLCAVYAASG